MEGGRDSYCGWLAASHKVDGNCSHCREYQFTINRTSLGKCQPATTKLVSVISHFHITHIRYFYHILTHLLLSPPICNTAPNS